MGDYEDGWEAALRSEAVGYSRKNREDLAAYKAKVAGVIARCEAEVGAVGDSYDIGYEDAMSRAADWLREIEGDGT